jgi:micrococcal nuclease
MYPTRLRRPLRKTLLAGAALFFAATRAGPMHAASLVPPASGPCSLEATARATITEIDANLDIALADGRTLTLVGLDPPRDTPDHPRLATDAREKLAAWLDGREVAARALADMANRFGLIPARLFAAPPNVRLGTAGAEIGVGEAILDAGLARYRPDAAAHGCRESLLAAEAEARTAKIGLWADPAYAILPAGDRAAFATPRTGMVLVEGTRQASAKRPPVSI